MLVHVEASNIVGAMNSPQPPDLDADESDATAPDRAVAHPGDGLPLIAPRTLVGAAAVIISLGTAAAILGRSSGGDLTMAAAVLLGLVEGLTEWLPISSTGHLTVTQELLGIQGDAANSYAIAIQAGAILAVLWLYWRRFLAMLRGLTGDDPEGRRLLIALAVACLPAVVVALSLEDVIKGRLFGPWPVVAAWFVGGLVILEVARRRRDLDPLSGADLAVLSWRPALVIGVAQILALWPGVSRSLVTIVAGTAVGLSVPAAVEFSFLLGFVILSGATGYELAASGAEMASAYGVVTPLVGLVVAFLSAFAAMRWMVSYLQRNGLGIFGWYRIGIAGVVTALLLTGVI